MEFGLSDQQRELQAAARKFARAELPDLARELEKEDKPVPHEMVRRYGELGFLGINLPEQYGGLGLGHVEALLVLEEFAQISVAVAFPVFEALTGPVRTIEQFGSDALKAKILPEVIRGEKIVAVAMSEPDAGTALTDLTTTAKMDGDSIVLNGRKRWSSGAGHSDYYIAYCRFDSVEGAKGIGAVIVEKDDAGVSFGAREELMGFRGIPSADIFLDDVRVPAGNLIVGAGGFGKLMSAFGLERCGNATMGLGVAAAALEDALRAAWDGIAAKVHVSTGDTKQVLNLDQVEIPEIGNVELPRLSTLKLSAALPPGDDPVVIGFAPDLGPLVVRQAGVEAGYAAFLTSGTLSEPIPRQGALTQGPLAAFVDYIGVGFDHIVPQGLDHILFVLGLFFLSLRLSPLLWQVSAFKLAPTITLALGILGYVRVPAEMVEPLIAPSDIATAVFFDDEGEAMYGGSYAMSKAAQRALVSRWQAESAKHGPRVALLKPNPMPTAATARPMTGSAVG